MTVRPVRIANCSGFYGDRLSAAREMVTGGPLDVLTGDWLAELTMLLLARSRQRRPDGGYATTFLRQLDEVLPTCLEKGIRVVSNAGGLEPHACADAVRALAERQGVSVRVAVVTGDDMLDRLRGLQDEGETLAHLDSGEPLDLDRLIPVTANAYLGGWGIAAALAADADVVVTGRVTDAALVVGPAAWWHGWRRDQWDELAGAVVAGHIIECGAQTTGGNYAFFQEIPHVERCGFPLAEVAGDGSSVITKHPGTGGAVTVGTVTAQLLYEIDSARYFNPDVVARFDTIRLDQIGPDRVRVSGVKGEAAPGRLKVAINYEGGFRNSMTMVLTGTDIAAKAAVAEACVWAGLPGGRGLFDEVAVHLSGASGGDPATNDEALAWLTITVVGQDERAVGRAFSGVVVETALASYPGYFTTTPPGPATAIGVYWPATVAARHVDHHVVLPDGRRSTIPHPEATAGEQPPADAGVYEHPTRRDWGPCRRVPFGTVVGARSGDKGGNANIGLWARSDIAWRWLNDFVTEETVRGLIPEAAELTLRVARLPNLRAINVVVVGILGRGVAASTRTDPQAKGLGEYVRARLVDVPVAVLEAAPEV